MKETVLIFHMTDKNRRLKLELALFPLHARIRYVKANECDMKLSDLAALKSAPSQLGEARDLTEPMLIFAFFDDNKLVQALRAINNSGAGDFPYKAALTPVNQNWTARECFSQLNSEVISQRQKGGKE